MDLAIRLRDKKLDLANHMSDVGHHSPEARAVQTLMRALDGWSGGALGASEMFVLAHQGVEDWLRNRLSRSNWDPTHFLDLVCLAQSRGMIDRREAFRLARMHQRWQQVRFSGKRLQGARVAVLLFWLIEFIERRW